MLGHNPSHFHLVETVLAEHTSLARRMVVTILLKEVLYVSARIFQNAWRRGELKRSRKCEACGSRKRIVGHHEDYYKPLEVQWLCDRCHCKQDHTEIIIDLIWRLSEAKDWLRAHHVSLGDAN